MSNEHVYAANATVRDFNFFFAKSNKNGTVSAFAYALRLSVFRPKQAMQYTIVLMAEQCA